MKYLLMLFFALLSVGASAQKLSDEQQIMATLHHQQEAWNKGDLKKFMDGYEKSDSLLFVGTSGPSYGWQKALDNYKKGYPDKRAMGSLTFGIKKIKLLGTDAAFVMGSWSLSRAKDNPHGFFTLLFKKINDQWKITVDHTSSSKE